MALALERGFSLFPRFRDELNASQNGRTFVATENADEAAKFWRYLETAPHSVGGHRRSHLA